MEGAMKGAGLLHWKVDQLWSWKDRTEPLLHSIRTSVRWVLGILMIVQPVVIALIVKAFTG